MNYGCCKVCGTKLSVVFCKEPIVRVINGVKVSTNKERIVRSHLKCEHGHTTPIPK